MPIKINNSRCIQCIGCASVCPTGALELQGLSMVFHPEKCISCGICARACPANAITFTPKNEKEKKKRTDSNEKK